MTDVFLLGAGFSRAVCSTMPTMRDLYDLLEPTVNDPDGPSREAYDYASGNAETLLSYYAIPSPQDDRIQLLRKRQVTAYLEDKIGEIISEKEEEGATLGLNPRVRRLLSKWHEEKTHVLTTNYDTIIERLAAEGKYPTGGDQMQGLHYQILYPIPISTALSRHGTAILGPTRHETFTLYKLHGSTTWFKSDTEVTFDPIYGLSYDKTKDVRESNLVVDKRRFIVPPVYDKSSLLSHETIRSLWRQARDNAIRSADRLYVIGYSLPETDTAMQTLLWEGSQSGNGTKELYVVDLNSETVERYRNILGRFYQIQGQYTGGDDPFNRFIEDYAGTEYEQLGGTEETSGSGVEFVPAPTA